jgi:hypothetical protein
MKKLCYVRLDFEELFLKHILSVVVCDLLL